MCRIFGDRTYIEISPEHQIFYQDSTFTSTPRDISSEEHARIQRAVAVKYLSLVPQHDAFAVGSMPVILFDPEGSSKKWARGKEEAEKTMRTLTAEQ